MEQPVLVVQGDKDIQVSVGDAEALKAAQPQAELHLIENMNHVLKSCDTVDAGVQQATYTNPDLPVVEELLDVIEKFIKP